MTTSSDCSRTQGPSDRGEASETKPTWKYEKPPISKATVDFLRLRSADRRTIPRKLDHNVGLPSYNRLWPVRRPTVRVEGRTHLRYPLRVSQT